MEKLLIDTDVMVDFLRGLVGAVEFISTHADNVHFSAVTLTDLYAGIRDVREKRELDALLRCFPVIDVTAEVAQLAGGYRQHFGHDITFVEAVIAATAKYYGYRLVTLKRERFPMLNDVHVP